MPSYKTMWQEAVEEIGRLKAEVERLTDALFAGPDENLRELERTRLIVDLAGIARHMHVERFTPQQWKQRGHLPPVDFPDIKEPLWYAASIKEHFADLRPRRIWYDDPDAPSTVELRVCGKCRLVPAVSGACGCSPGLSPAA